MGMCDVSSGVDQLITSYQQRVIGCEKKTSFTSLKETNLRLSQIAISPASNGSY